MVINSTLLLFQIFAIFKPLNLFYIVALFIFNIVILFAFKNENYKKINNIYFKTILLLFIYDMLSVISKILDKKTNSSKSFAPFFILIGIGITVGIIAFFLKKENRDILNKVANATIIKNKKIQMEKGDVILCNNMDTNEPVIIPFQDRFLHLLALGPTGSGKTSQILIPLINQDMKNNEWGLTVIEPKGDLAEKVFAMGKYYNRDAIYFNPTLPDCPYFNPLYGDETDVIENMATTFKMLSASEKSNPFFDNMNENLIRNSLKVLKRLKENEATLIDLSALIYNSQGMGKIMINQFARLKAETAEIAKENGDIASWFLGEYFNERNKTYEHCSGLRSQVSKLTSNFHLRRVLNPPAGQNDVNFEKVIEDGKILAISTSQGELRELGRYLGYFIILNFQSAVFKRPGNENTRIPHFLYIDEFQSYSNPGFADMLTQGRSYKVASHLATQNRALMAMGAGRDGQNFVELVSTNARNIVIFPGGNARDAKYYSDEFGEIIETEYRKTIAKDKFNLLYGFKKIGYPKESIAESEITKARFSPSNIIFKNFGEITYRIVCDKTVQIPGVGIVSFIPKEFNQLLDNMVIQHHTEQLSKFEKNKKEITKEFYEELKNMTEVEDIIEEKEIKINEKTKSAIPTEPNKVDQLDDLI